MLHHYDKTHPSPVWSPYTKQDINKVERVQCQSARFIMGDYSSYSSVSNMIEILNLQSLEHRRSNASIILFYKIIDILMSISPNKLTPLTSVTRGHKCRFHHIYA